MLLWKINEEIYEYDYMGSAYMAGVQPFKIANSDAYFTMVTVAPTRSIYEPFYDLLFSIVLTSLISLLVLSVAILYYVKNYITTRIENVSKHLFAFFKYINLETTELPGNLRPRANDEIGQMAAAINENIKATKEGLDRDSQAVKESVSDRRHCQKRNLTGKNHS